MKDLKHLIYFENLLEDANNELVRQAQADGSIVLGYTCYHIPEVLLNVDNCISVRLRAPKTGSLDISTYYMSNYTCDYARALVERAIEGGYQFLDALIGVDACSAMNRAMEHFEVLKVNNKEKFFVTHTDMPLKVTDYYIDSYTTQMREHVLDRLTETFGVDTSDEALRKAVAEHNEVCKIISEIAEMRKLDNPIITGYEFHILNLVSYACPKALILPYLRETLAELKKRKPDAKSPYRARVAIVGSEIDDPMLTKLIENCGAFVVSDRYCFGSTPGREVIELNDEEPALRQLCRHVMEYSECARYISDEKVLQRRETADRLAREYHAEGIIYEQMKYCDYWGFERALVVSDRFCFGSTPGREVIELNDEEDVLRQICRHYMETSECARYISDEKVHQRRETADRLAREYNADGIIYEQMKYCDYWGFERALASYVLNTEYGWPVLSIDRVYNNGYSGQLRTRVQAFVESLEIKKIQRERGAK